MRMRDYDGRIRGFGVVLAWEERDEVWRDHKVWNVKFPKHDVISYPVHTYKMSREELAERFGGVM